MIYFVIFLVSLLACCAFAAGFILEHGKRREAEATVRDLQRVIDEKADADELAAKVKAKAEKPEAPKEWPPRDLNVGDEVDIDVGEGITTRGFIYDFEVDGDELDVVCRFKNFVRIEQRINSDEAHDRGGWWTASSSRVKFVDRPAPVVPGAP